MVRPTEVSLGRAHVRREFHFGKYGVGLNRGTIINKISQNELEIYETESKGEDLADHWESKTLRTMRIST